MARLSNGGFPLLLELCFGLRIIRTTSIGTLGPKFNLSTGTGALQDLSGSFQHNPRRSVSNDLQSVTLIIDTAPQSTILKCLPLREEGRKIVSGKVPRLPSYTRRYWGYF